MSESLEIKKMLDFCPGDLVQILTGENAGELGQIADIRLASDKRKLLYEVYVKAVDKMIPFLGNQIRFLSHAEE